MAEELGKKLFAEIEEVGFDEILSIIRKRDDAPYAPFRLPEIDRLLEIAVNARPSSRANTPAIVQIASHSSGAGKTHLIYNLVALVVVPPLSTAPGASHQSASCAIVIDTDGHFSVSRLVQQITLLLDSNSETQHLSPDEVQQRVTNALKHVHILRPQSLASTTATLLSLESYLFNSTQHHSFDRSVSLIALDSVSTFYWQDRADIEDAALNSLSNSTSSNKQPQQSGFHALSHALKTACTTFSCPGIYTLLSPPSYTPHPQTSRNNIPHPQSPASRRLANVHPSLSALTTLRLLVHRRPVLRFPPAISVEETRREAGDRQKAVDRGVFECWVDEGGLEERVARRVREMGGGRFEFRVLAMGVVLERREGEEEKKGDGDGDGGG